MDKKEIINLSELARIELSSQEIEKIQLDFEKLLEYAKQLQQIDTTNIESVLRGSKARNVFREDIVNEKKLNQREILIKSAFDIEGDYFKTPPVF
ncbi:MAG: Asp-tRNA(Asn)/Glu-tRNA(Gln) amidotransferase subunit GatC [Candidatus Pacebacteria bacterium]|jgi:aspartyl-tRNA(Asn)/glutamyl-tRNA(Gln) amidotransferase subunit C|nr:Asp-tRNA(Asn)/Glu-tRNA(Gln) amidotransferase subunit GatC [Candidatus Paceibacterota bacterium]